MKKRTKEPWMAADAFGRSIPAGLSVNLLVADIARSTEFARAVLGAEVIYEDEDFAVVTACHAQWMLHADHAYLDHPMSGIIAGCEARGCGAELRLSGRDPDTAEKAAREEGHPILSGAIDKPHGVREVHIVDPDGYVWVADIPVP